MKPCHCKTIPMQSQPTLQRFTGPRPPCARRGLWGALAGREEQHCTSSMSREGLANVGDKIVRMLDPDRHANQ
jgi:hypothetical protein